MKRICFLLSFFCVISFSVSSQTKKEPLFGKSHSSYTVSSSSLKGAVFYLVSGHGGPDPGCIGKYQGKELHEDEYAYDIILRLGKELTPGEGGKGLFYHSGCKGRYPRLLYSEEQQA